MIVRTDDARSPFDLDRVSWKAAICPMLVKPMSRYRNSRATAFHERHTRASERLVRMQIAHASMGMVAKGGLIRKDGSIAQSKMMDKTSAGRCAYPL